MFHLKTSNSEFRHLELWQVSFSSAPPTPGPGGPHFPSLVLLFNFCLLPVGALFPNQSCFVPPAPCAPFLLHSHLHVVKKVLFAFWSF